MTTVQEQAHERLTGFRQYLRREAGERVWSVGGALRAHLNNFHVDALKDYIALSRHQFELIEFVTQRTGMDTAEPQRFEVMNWSTGKPDIWIDRGKPRTDEIPEWELQILEDMAWRAQAMGRFLSIFERDMTITRPEDLMELSRHQCEMLNFLKTGSFRKVPGRRKARTISGGGSTPQSEERIKILGEALKEYQGRIEIKTVREFIALSKHQCELAGLLFAEHESGQPVFKVVGYHADGVAGAEAYPNAVGSSGPVGKCPQERGKSRATRIEGEDECFVMSEPKGRVEKMHSERMRADEEQCVSSLNLIAEGKNRPSAARTRGKSSFPGVPFCDTFGHAKVSEKFPDRSENGPYIKNLPFEAVRLNSEYTYTLPRVQLLPGGKVPLPTDGRWIRVETPDGPLAMRSIPPPEPVWFDDVWEDDYWDEDWDEDWDDP